MQFEHRWAALVLAAALLGAGLPFAAAAKQAAPQATDAGFLSSSLPAVTSGSRPGPDVLYSPPPRAPQLENVQPAFAARFDRVSGTERYIDGEYLYTDHLYDDRGAGNAVTYPSDRSRYGDNAADLVEFRVSTREAGHVSFRFTLNSLLAADTTMAVAAFDTDGDAATGNATLPFDPRSPFPGTDAVLSAWGTGAAWSTWEGSTWTTVPIEAAVDLERNQIVARIPADLAGIATAKAWRATVGVGLRDPRTGSFLLPAEDRSATQPGGGGNRSAIFNLAFRFDEPVTTKGGDPDTNQGRALADGAPTRYARTIDLVALRSGSSRTTVPATGPMVRFFPSRLSLGEGKDLDAFPAFLGQLQSYSVYVPTTYVAGSPTPLTLNLHSLGERHWQYNGKTGTQQLGEQRNNLVATADARGEDGWYQDEAEFDVFEMWNDIASHFSLDPARTSITGYSMGGYATYRLGTLYPDLFARAVTVVGPPGDGIWFGAGAPTGGAATLSNLWLENARNLPYLNIVAAADELVPISGTTQQNAGPAYSGRTSFEALGYRHAFDVYPAAEHLTLALLGYNLPQARDFLGDHRIDRDPFHVTFAYTPAADNRDLGLVHDKAYWVSDVRLRDRAVGTKVSTTAAAIGKGVIDAESHAFGVDDPASMSGAGFGTVPLPYFETNRTWGAAPVRTEANRLEVQLTNIGAARLDLARARIDSSRRITLSVATDGPTQLVLVGKHGRTTVLEAVAGRTEYTVAPASFHTPAD